MFQTIARPWRRRRFELLDHLECLKSPHLRLDEVTVAGLVHGCAAPRLARDRVVAARAAPILANWRTSACGERLYVGHAGQPLTLSDVVDSALRSDGLLVLRENIGIVLRAGEVRAIEIYRPVLKHFCYIRSYVDLLGQFGLPEAVKTREADGNPTHRTLLYPGNSKQLVWRCRDNALNLVRLGDLDDAPQRRQPPRGGKRRFVMPRLPVGLPRPVVGPPAWSCARHAT